MKAAKPNASPNRGADIRHAEAHILDLWQNTEV